MPSQSIVITGIGMVSSIGIGADEYFEALMNQASGIRSLRERTDGGVRPNEASLQGELAGLWTGAPIVDFEPKQYVKPRKALKVMCREIQTAFAASTLAIEHAGLTDSFPCDPESSLRPEQVGTVFGSEMFYGPPDEMLDAYEASMDESGTFRGARFGAVAMKQLTPLWMLKYLPNMPACHVGISINAHGPNNSLVLGDVSGPAAMMEARSCLERGVADIMVTGAVGTRINTTRLNYRGDLPVAQVSGEKGDKEITSRPHHQDAQGVVGGEAAASFVIETDSMARKRGATPIATIAAMSCRFVASESFRSMARSTAPVASAGRGSAQSIKRSIMDCLRQADLSPNDVGAIVSSACGDPSIDEAEQQAVESTLPSNVPVVAPSAAIGHTGAAIGAIGIATAAMMIKTHRIPPTQHDPRRVTVRFLEEAISLENRAVISLAHTSEGSAVATLLKPA